MDIHQNARTTPHSRAAMVRRVRAGEPPKSVAAGVGVCDKTVRKWARRFAGEGPAGLADRSSRVHRLHRPIALAVVEQALETASLMLGGQKARGHCLEMICADFLAGVSLEAGNQDALLPSLIRMVIGLPKPQRQQLLENVQGTIDSDTCQTAPLEA